MCNEIGKFEELIDNEIKKIDLSEYHINDVLEYFNQLLAMNLSGEKLSSNKYNIEPTTSFPSTISYILPLLNQCKKEFNTDNTKKDKLFKIMEKQYSNYLNYLLFCEIAPFIRKKVYLPKVIGNKLKLPYNTNYYKYELRDSTLTTLATGFTITNDLEDSYLYDTIINDTIENNGKINTNFMIFRTIKYKKWFKDKRFDDSLVSKEVYDALNITKEHYVEFQTFWLAITTYYIKLYEALIRFIRNASLTENKLIEDLLCKFSSPCLDKDIFYTLITESLIGIPKNIFLNLMNIFSLKFTDWFTLHDGHYPIFIEYPDLYFFSPYNIRVQLSPRNLLYLLNKNNTNLFNNAVSKHLEPQLINYAVELLSKIPNLIIKENVKWNRKGEFDIIAYEPTQNCILHFQAKGTIPAEGGRMTRNLEGRISEGIEQIKKFNSCSNKDTIISTIFETQILNPTYIDVLLGWGGFGTFKVWNVLENEKVTALNISILNQYIKEFNNNYNFLNFFNDINLLIDNIISLTKPKKVMKKIKINQYKIEYGTFYNSQTKLIKFKYFQE